MTGEDDDAGEKEHEASPKKLEEARKKGDIPRSTDLFAAAAIAGFVLVLVAMGGWLVQSMGIAGIVVLGQADLLSRLVVEGAAAPVGGMLLAFLGPAFVLLAIPPLLVIAASVALQAFRLTPGNLAPKLSRISPVALARHKFGSEGLVEFAKSTFKMVLVSGLLYLFVIARIDDIIGSLYLEPALASALLADLTIDFLVIVLLITAAIGGVDYLLQVHLHRQRNRMSRKELMDEYKESEGDPHLKAERRQRAQSVATNRMLADVATADVVVVNPTHYAVALRWDRTRQGAPVCVAKGVDEIAAVIRARAAEHGVPIHRDPPTARAIHATVELGMEVRVEHYRAVAAAIRFADAMRKRARKQ